MLSVSTILCIILHLCRAAFLPHYRDYSDGGWAFGDIILLKSGVSVEIRGVTLSNYI